MSKVRRDSCLSSTNRTLKHPNISQPLTSLNFPSAPLPISRIPQTQSLQIGLLADACRDAAPLRGGSMSGFAPCKVISSKLNLCYLADPETQSPSLFYSCFRL